MPSNQGSGSPACHMAGRWHIGWGWCRRGRGPEVEVFPGLRKPSPLLWGIGVGRWPGKRAASSRVLTDPPPPSAEGPLPSSCFRPLPPLPASSSSLLYSFPLSQSLKKLKSVLGRDWATQGFVVVKAGHLGGVGFPPFCFTGESRMSQSQQNGLEALCTFPP